MMSVVELQTEIRDRPQETPRPSPLTERQREVVLAYSRGLKLGQMATFLGMSPHTIRSHRQTIFTKMHVHTMPAACSLALREGWIC